MTPAAGDGDTVGPVDTPAVAAVIDIGSNSVLLLVLGVEPDGRARALDEALVTTRLGTGLHRGSGLDPAARARTREVVVALAARARVRGATHVWAFATGAARDAADGVAFTRELEAAAGVPVEVLAGEREARLAYAAVVATAEVPALLAVDVGGRSTELTLGAASDVTAAVSLPVGALILTEAHLHADPPTRREIVAAGAVVEAALAATDVPARARTARAAVVASGGTATALAALDLGLAAYDPVRVHGHVLARATLQALGERLAAIPAAARVVSSGLDPGRAMILPAGAVILERVLAASGAASVRVSVHGVRHAYLRERLTAIGVSFDLRRLWS